VSRNLRGHTFESISIYSALLNSINYIGNLILILLSLTIDNIKYYLTLLLINTKALNDTLNLFHINGNITKIKDNNIETNETDENENLDVDNESNEYEDEDENNNDELDEDKLLTNSSTNTTEKGKKYTEKDLRFYE
jgi:hypothetical protein